MKRYLWAISVLVVIVMAGMSSAFSEQIRVATTCRQGECDTVWLISKTRNRDGTFTVKTRFERFNINPRSSKEPDDFDSATVSCSPTNGYVRWHDGELTREPPEGGSGAHATCEPDSLWARICGRKIEPTC